MKTFNTIALGSKAKDTVTGLNGIITHLVFLSQNSFQYTFVPEGLNKETNRPLYSHHMEPWRIEGKEMEDIDVPVELIGTNAEEENSGFKGVIAALTVHVNKCVHAAIQPKELDKEGEPVRDCDFDLRRLKGPAIKKMTKEELKTSHKEKPSPVDTHKSLFERI